MWVVFYLPLSLARSVCLFLDLRLHMTVKIVNKRKQLLNAAVCESV